MSNMLCSACSNEIQEVLETKPDGMKRLSYTCPCGYAKPGSTEPPQPQSPEEALASMWPFIDDTNFYD